MIGQRVSHYQITSKLGEGGMGTVYRADDTNLRRAVALKLLPNDLELSTSARHRLLKEAQLASRLNHPNIATIYEVGEANEVPFIAMEFIEGETLRDALKRGAIPIGRLLEIAEQVAQGLREAHQAGVIHCDIKPGNVMIDSRSRVRLLDFGLSTLTTPERRPGESGESFITRSVSRSGSCSGTIPYMAPELLREAAPDARSDIFAFGVLLYECIAGRLPFPGETAIDVFHRILHQPAVPIRSLVPDIPPPLEHVIDKCLSKSPEQRFPDMDGVLQALARVSVADPKSEKSVAVLYFQNMSEATADAYFRDGMVEDIITELAKIKQLRVFPRSTVIPYRDKLMTAPEIGQKLDARADGSGDSRSTSTERVPIPPAGSRESLFYPCTDSRKES